MCNALTVCVMTLPSFFLPTAPSAGLSSRRSSYSYATMQRIAIINGARRISGVVRPHIFRGLSTDVTRPQLQEIHAQYVQAGVLKEDIHQTKILKLMEKLRNHLEKYDFQSLDKATDSTSTKADNADNQNNDKREAKDTDPNVTHSIPRLRGIYIHGPVGSGKTMLMDMFFKHCNVPAKRRVHFHEFMLEVHRRIHEHKQQLLQQYGQDRHVQLTSSRDSIKLIAQQISQEAKLLCFDEFQVTDICDALIMTRLFNELWMYGTVLIATSNRPPEDLYLNGLNRHDFLPFITRLTQECLIRNLDAQIDYRVAESTIVTKHSLVPNTPEHRAAIFAAYEETIRNAMNNSTSLFSPTPTIPSSSSSTNLSTPSSSSSRQSIPQCPKTNQYLVPIPGHRTFPLQYAEPPLGICLVDFDALCQSDRGASDYRALVSHFHTIFVTNIPRLSTSGHNAARRFITFIDEVYNHTVQLYWVADAEPNELFVSKKVTTEENFEEQNASQTVSGSKKILDGDEYRSKSINAEDTMTPHILNKPAVKEYSRNYQPGMYCFLCNV
jgi:predicted ATPase